jgi:hypothetical protein
MFRQTLSECTFQNYTPLYRFTLSHLGSTSYIALPLLRILSGHLRFDEQYEIGKKLTMHTMQLRKINGYLQKLLYTVKRIRMSPTPTLNIYLLESSIPADR